MPSLLGATHSTPPTAPPRRSDFDLARRNGRFTGKPGNWVDHLTFYMDLTAVNHAIGGGLHACIH